MNAEAPKGPKVKCPTCGETTVFAPSNPWRPFCSERCRELDLGAWATESYRVASKPDDAEEDENAKD